jgi:hypothetical protein
MALLSCPHIDFVTFDLAGKDDRGRAIDDPLAELLDHRPGVARAQVEFLGDLQAGQIQAHEIQADNPGSQGFVMPSEDRPGEVVKPLSASVTFVALPIALGLVSTILDDAIRRAMRTGNAIGPTHSSDRLEAPGVVDEIPDV